MDHDADSFLFVISQIGEEVLHLRYFGYSGIFGHRFVSLKISRPTAIRATKMPAMIGSATCIFRLTDVNKAQLASQ